MRPPTTTHSASGTAKRSVIFTAPPLLSCTSLDQRTGHPGYREPRPVQMGFVATRCHLSPFASFRPTSEALRLRKWKTVETQRECFQALWVHGWPSQALCRPFKNIHGEFPHPHQPYPPTVLFHATSKHVYGNFIDSPFVQPVRSLRSFQNNACTSAHGLR